MWCAQCGRLEMVVYILNRPSYRIFPCYHKDPVLMLQAGADLKLLAHNLSPSKL